MLRTGLALIVWITFAFGFCPSPWDDRQVWFGGDQARLLQSADDVLAGEPPLAGAYSKDSLFHPGPLFSYLLALVQFTTRGDVALTNVVVSVIQAATMPFLVLFAQRLSGSWIVALTLPFLIVFNFAFLFYVRIIWNVAIVLPALSLALWLTWEITPTSTRLLPLLAFILCFLAQAHMAYTPLAVTLGLVALARFLSSGVAGRWATIALTAVVVLACWSPVVWDAIRHEGGNIGALLRHFGRDARGGHDLWTAFGAIHGVGLYAMPRGFPLLWALALSTVLMASTFWRRDESATAAHLRRLALVLGCAWIVVLVSISRIPGAIDPYYLRPLSVMLVVHLMGGIAALLLWLQPWKAWARVMEGAIAAGVIIGAAPPAQAEWSRFQTTSWNAYPLREMRVVARSIDSDLRGVTANGPPVARVEFQPPHLRGWEAAMVYVLRREQIVLSRDPHDARAPVYRILYRIRLEPASQLPGRDSGLDVIRTDRFRVERVSPQAHSRRSSSPARRENSAVAAAAEIRLPRPSYR